MRGETSVSSHLCEGDWMCAAGVTVVRDISWLGEREGEGGRGEGGQSDRGNAWNGVQTSWNKMWTCTVSQSGSGQENITASVTPSPSSVHTHMHQY